MMLPLLSLVRSALCLDQIVRVLASRNVLPPPLAFRLAGSCLSRAHRTLGPIDPVSHPPCGLAVLWRSISITDVGNFYAPVPADLVPDRQMTDIPSCLYLLRTCVADNCCYHLTEPCYDRPVCRRLLM